MSSDYKSEVKQKKSFYFREVQRELKRVSWTPRKELINSTKVVLLSVLMFGLGIYGVDVVIRYMFSSINHLFKIIFG